MTKPINAELIAYLEAIHLGRADSTSNDRDDYHHERNSHSDTKQKANGSKQIEWPYPKPVQGGLAPVDPFDIAFMPKALGPWIDDIANRLQCPPDYVAVAAITSLGSVIGRRAGIKPQLKTDWVEVPNLWGCFVGRPGMLKSPAMGEALKPLHRLEAEAAKDYEIEVEAFQAGMSAYQIRKQVKMLIKEDLKKKKDITSEINLGLDEPKEPIPVRYRTNDSTYELLGELLINNPTGVLVERDELISLLTCLDRDDQAVARGFYLSGWSGTQPYTYDRIGRGHRPVDAVCMSVLGNTQPARISEYVRRANAGGTGGDGLIQRFGLFVWPDASPSWRDVDEYPNSRAREVAWVVYERASKLDAISMGAHKGAYDRIPCFRFAGDALVEFQDWRSDLEQRLRSGNLSPALEGHIAKHRTLVPALALINHIADSGSGDVSREALIRALAFAGYLEGHARRLYASGSESEIGAANAILARIKREDLKDGFTARDVHQRGWAHLTERDQVAAGLSLLIDLDYLAEVASDHPKGGRPKIKHLIDAKALLNDQSISRKIA